MPWQRIAMTQARLRRAGVPGARVAAALLQAPAEHGV